MNNITLVAYLFMSMLSYNTDNLDVETTVETVPPVVQVANVLDKGKRHNYNWC